jgi:putative ABC transport system substrate-binding protein
MPRPSGQRPLYGIQRGGLNFRNGSISNCRVRRRSGADRPLIDRNRTRVLDFATTNRLPASFDVGKELVHEGGLISYGPVLTAHYAIAADYVDKILKGAKPGDLPVQQSTRCALIINLRTAKALGLTVP